ncbi:MAG: hypothetical protein IMW98_08575 [Firmicutes bacterium]|nr:hypothetical protein [Bacillota bacterium]MBE3590860.1 hypothetical protein [Bacillota bacterium]
MDDLGRAAKIVAITWAAAMAVGVAGIVAIAAIWLHIIRTAAEVVVPWAW